MEALCLRCQVGPWQRDLTRISVLVLVIIILVITAVEGWALDAVAAVIAAATAAAAAAGGHKAAG